MIKTFLPLALSGHLLHKLLQFWLGRRRGTVPISSLPLFKPVKSNYFSPKLCILSLCESFWILISADLFLKWILNKWKSWTP